MLPEKNKLVPTGRDPFGQRKEFKTVTARKQTLPWKLREMAGTLRRRTAISLGQRAVGVHCNVTTHKKTNLKN